MIGGYYKGVRDVVSGNLKMVEGWPALLLGKTLVIADVHIGIEKELWQAGIFASNVSELALRKFKKLLEIVEPKKIVINGDLRHNIPTFTKKEAEKVREFVETGETYGKVLVVKGNHDGGIESIIDNVVGTVYREKGFYITHGHVSIPHRPAIIGHLHPAFPLDLHFRREMIKVWLLSPGVVVLPAFSPFIVGNDVSDPGNWLGPIARREKRFKVFSLDGFFLGEVEKEEEKEVA